MTQIIHNPIAWSDIESGMTPAEESFVACVGKGAPCILGHIVPENKGRDKKVRAKVIQFLAFGGDDEHPVGGMSINLSGARVVGELNLIHAQIPYSLGFFCCRFSAAVNMLRAKCAALYLNGTLLIKGLQGDGLQTEGGVFLRSGFSAEGEVRFSGARIGGNLECDDGKFSNPGGDALSAGEIRIGGNVFLRNGFSAEGEVRLTGAHIGGNLECDSGKFSNPNSGKMAIVARNVKINNALLWRNTTCSGIVDFASGMAGILVDDVDKQPAKPLYQMRLEGFTYNRFSIPGNVQSRLRWLANRPIGYKFSPLPYEQAASVLFAMGHDDDARAILLEKERERTKIASFWARVVRKVWDILVGYGYRPWKSLWWSIGVILLGAGIFYCADESGHIIPHQPVVLVNSQYLACCNSSERPTEAVARLFPDYPRFNAVVFSADVFIPFFALHQEPYWHPATDKDFISGLILWWYRAEIFFGWVLTSLFLLSITGLLRPRQHSGKG